MTSSIKIGIYGDSFGAGFAHKISKSMQDHVAYIGDSWVEILSKTYQVTNYCEFSSSLVHSANTFVNTHHLYDKVMFLVTCPGRITMGFPNDRQPLPHFISYDSAKRWESIAKKDGWLTELNSVINYYLYVYSPEYEKLIHQSLVDKIKSIRDDVIVIPNFHDSFEHIHCNTLDDIFNMENTEWQVSYPIFDYDLRKCHLTKENNEILASHAVKWLNGDKVVINVDDFVKPLLPKTRYIFPEVF